MLTNVWKGLIETNLETYLPTNSYYISLGTGTTSESAADTTLAQDSELTRRIAGAADGGSRTLDTTNNQDLAVFWIPSTVGNNLLSTQNNSTVITTADGSIGGGDFVAQKIQLPYTANVTQIKLYVEKTGTPGADLTVEIQTDNSGVPSGTVVTNGSTSIAEADIGTAYAWETALFSTAPSLTGVTDYWIVLSESSGSSGDYYLNYDNGNSLAMGGVGLSTDSGSSWTTDATDTGMAKVYINKFSEVGVWDAVTGGNLISRNLLSVPLTKDDTIEYQISLWDNYSVSIN